VAAEVGGELVCVVTNSIGEEQCLYNVLLDGHSIVCLIDRGGDPVLLRIGMVLPGSSCRD